MSFEEDNQENTNAEKNQSENASQSNPHIFQKIKCPKCGSVLIKKRRIIVSFLLPTVFLFIFLLLLELIALLQSAKSGIAIAFVVTLLFCVLFTTAWLGLVEIRRCKSCGHHFHSLYRIRQDENTIPFPWLFVVLNGIIIFFICVASREMTRFIIYGIFSFPIAYVCIEVFLAALPTGFLIAFSLSYQAVVYLFLKRRIKNLLLWAILFLMPSILLGTGSFYSNLPKIRAEKILSYGRLTALPKSAHHVKEYSWSSLFSGEWFLSFGATPDEIDNFLNLSSSLKEQPCQSFSPEKMRIPYVDDLKTSEEHHRAGHETFVPDSSAPPWYREEIRGNGRYYKIPAEGFHNWGEVIVDDVNNIVYIKVIWS